MAPEFQQLIDFYKTLEEPKWQDASVFASFKVTSETKYFINAFHDTLDMEIENHEGLVIDESEIESYQNLQLKFIPTRNESFFFAKNFNDLLNNFNFSYTPPNEFYIAEIDGYCKNNESENKKIKSYLCLIKIFNLLYGIADHTEINQNLKSLIFLSPTGKEEIPLKYTENLFQDEKFIYDIDKFKEELISSPHKKTKIALFKKAISQHTQGLNESSKISSLFSEFQEIEKRYNNNYELFLNEFSFEDEKEKLEEKKQSYLLKLNEVLSGIHGKLFAVPASVIIVAAQMKTANDAGYELVNTIILIGAFVFSLFMWMLTANQLHSLLALKTDYDAKKERLKLELRESLYNDLNTSFEQLDKRFKYQKRMILLIDILVLLALIFSFIVFEYQTKIIANYWF